MVWPTRRATRLFICTVPLNIPWDGRDFHSSLRIEKPLKWKVEMEEEGRMIGVPEVKVTSRYGKVCTDVRLGKEAEGWGQS